jgi:hypothetical protein
LNGDAEFVDEADQASAVVQQQIVSVIDAARGAALSIERRARDAEEQRRRAHEQAGQVLEALRRIESELMLLVSQVGREADALRTTMERSAPEVASVHATVLPPVETEAGEPEPAEVDPEPEPAEQHSVGAAAERTAELAAAPPPVADQPTVSAQTVQAPEPKPEPARDPDAELHAEARKRVAGKDDLELAEMHAIASGRTRKGSDDERRYWLALEAAVVTEAANRPSFGQADEASLGRRARRKRAKALQPLIAARERAIQEGRG